MKIDEFKLERYFAKHEFSSRYILCASDCESFKVKDLASEEELSELESLRLEYSESQGNSILRKEIAKLFQVVTPEEIIVSAPEEGIFITMNTLLDAGDNVIVQFPCYPALIELPKAIGCKAVTWMPEIIENRWRWDVSFLKENVNKDTKMVVINSPHNPTGHQFTEQEYREIIDIAKENDCIVFSDEMYRLLEHRKKDRLPIGSDVYEKCISLSGMSKTFGLGGLRIGWQSIREKALLEKIAKFKDYTTISNSALSEHVALFALRKKNLIISRNLRLIKSNLRLLDSFFARYPDKFVWFRPQAGSIALVKIKFKMDVEDFCEDVVNKKGVMLMPSTKFDYGNEYFRIGFGRKNMPEALRLLEEYVKENL
jgi:aspartate/methionine/tyrosine aminotransferase